MRPSTLARLIIETVVADDLLDAVLDGLPRSLRQPTTLKREREWEVALAQQLDVRPQPGFEWLQRNTGQIFASFDGDWIARHFHAHLP